jgi:hypothetical protein
MNCLASRRGADRRSAYPGGAQQVGFPLHRGRSSVGRASASQAEGRGFEARRPLSAARGCETLDLRRAFGSHPNHPCTFPGGAAHAAQIAAVQPFGNHPLEALLAGRGHQSSRSPESTKLHLSSQPSLPPVCGPAAARPASGRGENLDVACCGHALCAPVRPITSGAQCALAGPMR